MMYGFQNDDPCIKAFLAIIQTTIFLLLYFEARVVLSSRGLIYFKAV